MITLEGNVESILWSPGASRSYRFDDFGGTFRVSPSAKMLTINVTDDSFHDVVFNGSVGEAAYELSYADLGSNGLFLKGDSRAIVNSSSFTMAQLQVSTGNTSQEITLSYRPFASSVSTGMKAGKPMNVVRVYLVSLNFSRSQAYSGKFRLIQRCVNVSSTVLDYDLSYAVSSIKLETTLDGLNSRVSVPISSNENGAFIELEMLVCNIQLTGVDL
jgi:hypothetical protein